MEEPKKPDDSLEGADSLENPDTVIQPGGQNTADASGSPAPEAPAPQQRMAKFDFQAYVRSLINKVNIYLLLFVFILVVAGVVLFIAIQAGRNQAKKDQTATQQLTADALKTLEGTDAKVGDPKQLLTIESDAVFNGKVLVRDGLEVAGAIKVGGALSLPGITVSGTSAFDQVTLNSLSVSGNETIQGQLNVQKGLTVGGNGSFGGSLSAAVINTDKLVLNQDLQLNRHIVAGGTTPSIATGGATGGGGTVSINGSDTSGTITVNNGSGAIDGIVATVTFAVKFSGNPHVVISPVCTLGGACPSRSYITNRTSSGFSVAVAGNAAGSYSFDYIVLD
jgi:cytoskeletal protein CcmA (bactofilin family)